MRAPCKQIRKACKRCAVRLLCCIPRLPACLWDRYVDVRVGTTQPSHPEVDFLSHPDAPPERVFLNRLPAKDVGTIRFVIISDTHERHRLVSLPKGDVFLHCGDIFMSSTLSTKHRGKRVLLDFNDWLQSEVQCAEKVIIGGNHDEVLQDLGDETRAILSAARWLQDSCVELPLAGMKVYGNGYSQGDSHNKAWQCEGRAPSICRDACAGADVVMTHCCDSLVREEVFLLTRPQLWASGHWHDEHGIREHEGVIFVNAAIQDKGYNPTQPPIVVDLPAKSARI